MSKKKSPTKRTAETEDDTRDRLTSELTHGLALSAAHKAVPAGLAWNDGRDDQVLAQITLDIGRQYFEIAKAERWLATLRVSARAPAIPVDAQGALLSMINQIEHEFFCPYITAAIVTGVAAGLKGYGANCVKPKMDGAK